MFVFVVNNQTIKEYENRQVLSEANKDLAYLKWIENNPLFLKSQNKKIANLSLVAVFQNYLDKQNKRVDECAPNNFEKFNFCANEIMVYKTAKQHVKDGYVSVDNPHTRSKKFRSFKITRSLLENKIASIELSHELYGKI